MGEGWRAPSPGPAAVHSQDQRSRRLPVEEGMVVPCACFFLPGCVACHAAAPNPTRRVPQHLARWSCACFLPGCITCTQGGARQTGGQTPSAGMAATARTRRPLQKDVDEDSDTGVDFAQEAASVQAALPFNSRGADVLKRARPCKMGQKRFLEVWAGQAGLTRAAERHGLLALPSVDVLPGQGRITLDLLQEQDRATLWHVVARGRPHWIHVGPPCGFWVQIGRCTARRTPEQWLALRRAARDHLRLATQIFRHQSEHGLFASFEQPPHSVSWRLPRVQALQDLPSWCEVTFPSCAYGAKDPISGRPWRKRQKIAANFDISKLALKCTCEQEHQVVEAWRTRLAGAYPKQMCDALVACALQAWQHPTRSAIAL